MEGFTKREVEEAQKAREAEELLGHPTNHDFLEMVRGGMLSNCPVTALSPFVNLGMQHDGRRAEPWMKKITTFCVIVGR